MQIMRQEKWGWPAVLLLSLVPILLWSLAPSVTPRWSGSINVFTSLGQLFGLVGASMFALNLVLSARFKLLEKYFNGLNRIYDRHQLFGQMAFVLLLFHPLWLLPKYAVGSAWSAATFLLPLNNTAQNLGWWALFMMIVLIVLTLYLRPRYNIWKLTHKFFGLAFLFAGLHIFLIPSDTSVYPPLKIYLLTLVLVGLLAFAYRSLFHRWLVSKYVYVVSQVNRLNDKVVEIVMSPRGPIMRSRPGQFIFVSFKNFQVGQEVHPFSLTSAASSRDIAISVKASGDYTQRLGNLQVGDEAQVEGPFGVFDYRRGVYKDQIWIAGGIGITPFVSMARSLSADSDYQAELYYCTRNRKEMVYLAELKEIGSNLKVRPYYSDEQGYITIDKIAQSSGSIKGKSLYICAPPPMIKSLKEQLRLYGIGRRLIHSEEFNLD